MSDNRPDGRRNASPFSSSPTAAQARKDRRQPAHLDGADSNNSGGSGGLASRQSPSSSATSLTPLQMNRSGSVLLRGGPMRADTGANGVPRGGSVCRGSIRPHQPPHNSSATPSGGDGGSAAATTAPTAMTMMPTPTPPPGWDGGGTERPAAGATPETQTSTPPPPQPPSGQRRASFVDLAVDAPPPRMTRGHSGYLAQPRSLSPSLPNANATANAPAPHGSAAAAGSGGGGGLSRLNSVEAAASGAAWAAPRAPNSNAAHQPANLATSLSMLSPLPAAGAPSASGSGYAVGSVYSVRLDGDSGGVEMGLARGHLMSALRLRDRYHSALQSQRCAALPQSRAAPSASLPSSPPPPPLPLPPPPPQQQPSFNAAMVNLRMDDGVFVFGDTKFFPSTPAAPWEAFHDDFMNLCEIVQQPACQSACRYRLEVLEEKFCAYKLSNSDMEVRDGRPGDGGSRAVGHSTMGTAGGGGVGGAAASVPSGKGYHASPATATGSGVFADCWKVNNGVVFEYMVSPQGLVEFIQETLEVRGEEDVVAYLRSTNGSAMAGLVSSDAGNRGAATAAAAANASGGEQVTLQRMCELLGFPEPRDITVDTLGIQPSGERATPLYDPLDPAQNHTGCSSAALLRLFLSRDTLNRGEYVAQLVRPCLARNEARTRAPQATETIISITGLVPDDWARTALWLKSKQLLGDSYRHNRFTVMFSRPAMAAMAAVARSGGRGGVGGGVGGEGLAGADQTDGASEAALLAAAYSGAATPIVFEHHQQHLDSLFLPLFLATIAPEDPHNGAVADFLAHVGAIVVVPLEGSSGAPDSDGAGGVSGGAEGGRHHRMNEHKRTRPADVPWTETVSDVYFMYYVWANLCSLNALRRMRGLNTLQLRCVAASDSVSGSTGGFSGGVVQPYGGELTGGGRDTHQLPTTLLLSYMVSDVVFSGIGLNHLPVLQYLYCLKRIGVCMSPLAANALGMTDYTNHPFSRFFRRGLRVALGTFAPLLFHHSATDPLLEEFGTASKLYRMSGVDVCEVALNSVVMSSFPDTDSSSSQLPGHGDNASFIPGVAVSGSAGATKAAWLGEHFVREGWRGNVYALSGVPTARLAMREELWLAEMEVVHGGKSQQQPQQQLVTGPAAASLTPLPSQPVAATAGDSAVAPAPYLVTDPRTRFSRVALVGPYHRETRHASIAQHLHRALELRRMYVRSACRSSAGGDGGSALPAVVASTAAHQLLMGSGADGRLKADMLNVLTNLGSDAQAENVAEYLAYLVELYRSAGGAALRAPAASAGGGLPLTQQQFHSRGLEAAFSRKRSSGDKGGSGKTTGGVNRGLPHSGLGAGEDSDEDDFDEAEWMFKTVEGVVVPHEVHQIPRLPQDMFHYDDFCAHVEEIRAMANDSHIRSFAARRLCMLENRFMLHTAVNHSVEAGSTADKASQNRDFYQSSKVDCSVRMEAGMPARLLLDFILDKARNNGDDIVSHEKAREPQTLRQLLKELNISPETLTVDDLEVQVDPTLDWRSDGLDALDDDDSGHQRSGADGGAAAEGTLSHSRRRGRDILLSLLLRTDNQMNGRYFAELTKRTFENLSRDRFTFTESRLRVNGASSEEWSQLSTWFDTHGMGSARNQWMVEIPRAYGRWRRQGKVRHFAEFLENIFTPLWAVSLHPSRDPRLFHFLNHISAFDCVAAGPRGGDSNRSSGSGSHDGAGGGGGGGGPKGPISQQPLSSLPPPHEWFSEEDPPFNYYMYHLWANITSLNAFRRRRKFSQFSFRPSCGESGPVDHLIGGFLLANSITYGLELKSSAVLQYLYYLARIGIVMCPLSNNSSTAAPAAASTRASTLQQNPFPLFFKRGLCVTLGTDAPLKYHHTQEPLVEEYSIASKMWKLSPTDMCEIARSSVLISGFSPLFKMQRLGELFFLSSSAGNDPAKTHLSGVRVGYRFETYHGELGYLEYVAGQALPKAMLTLKEEEAVLAVLDGVKEQSQAHQQHPHPHPHQEDPNGATPVAKRVGFADGTFAGGTIIDATPDVAELQRLQGRRAQLRKQVEELAETVAQLQKRNQQLTTKLYEEKERDQQAALLRRQHLEGRLSLAHARPTLGEDTPQTFVESIARQLKHPHLIDAEGDRPLSRLPADTASGTSDDDDGARDAGSSGSHHGTLASSSEGAGGEAAGKRAQEARLGRTAATPTLTTSDGGHVAARTAAHPGALLAHTESLWRTATHPSSALRRSDGRAREGDSAADDGVAAPPADASTRLPPLRPGHTGSLS